VVAGEELNQDEWELDVVLTASQKSNWCTEDWHFDGFRKSDASWKTEKRLCLIIMQTGVGYTHNESLRRKKTAYYFGTPSNFNVALETKIICKERHRKKRVKRHQSLKAFRAAIASNLTILPKTFEIANTLTAVYYPEGVDGAALSSKMVDSNVIIAGGLLPEIKTYFLE
jgi:alanine-glyoxylate transaminase/serine-glyoxylate transaminase/serine-pyruvate transaminase